jgi:hypothetical protein
VCSVELEVEDEETFENRPYDKTWCVLSEADAEAEETLAQRDYNTRIWHQIADI